MLKNIASKAISGLSGLFTEDIYSLANGLIVGYKFYVFIGAVSLAFNKVSGIEQTYNYQTLQEGGVNNKLNFLQRPLESPSTIVFQDGGMTISAAKMKECFDTLPKEVLVLLCTASGKIKNVIIVKNAVISRVNIGQLDAGQSELVVSDIEMMYTGFSRIQL